MCNSSFGLCIRNNVITENICPDVGGPWPDNASTGISAYGNAIYRLRGIGYYIEAWALGTVLRWNTIFETDNGITFRGNCVTWPFRTTYSTAAAWDSKLAPQTLRTLSQRPAL